MDVIAIFFWGHAVECLETAVEGAGVVVSDLVHDFIDIELRAS